MEKLRHNQRRRVPRVMVDIPVTLTWGKKRFRTHAIQLSEFGTLVAGTYKDLVGEKVLVELQLEPPTGSLSTPAVVVYANDAGTGIRFEIDDLGKIADLKNYVQARGIGVIKPSQPTT